MASGPHLPDKGLFQYPANMDGGAHAIRYLMHRGPVACRHGTLRLRSQVAAITGGTASMARTLAHTSAHLCCSSHSKAVFLPHSLDTGLMLITNAGNLKSVK